MCVFLSHVTYTHKPFFFTLVFPTLTVTLALTLALALTYTHKYLQTSPRGTLVVDLSVTVQALPHTHQPNAFMFKKADAATTTTTATTTTEVVLPPASSSVTSGPLNS